MASFLGDGARGRHICRHGLGLAKRKEIVAELRRSRKCEVGLKEREGSTRSSRIARRLIWHEKG